MIHSFTFGPEQVLQAALHTRHEPPITLLPVRHDKQSVSLLPAQVSQVLLHATHSPDKSELVIKARSDSQVKQSVLAEPLHEAQEGWQSTQDPPTNVWLSWQDRQSVYVSPSHVKHELWHIMHFPKESDLGDVQVTH